MRIAESRSTGALTLLALAFLVATVVVTPTARAASRAPEGIWQGSLQGMMRLVVHVERGPGGALTGKLDSPDQGATGLAIDTMWFDRDTLRFQMRRIQADYLGWMNAGGDTIAGRWRQGGSVIPLDLRRSDKLPVVNRPQEPTRPLPYDTAAVVYDNAKAGVRIAGTLTVPRGTGPFPCALLITGSGPEDRDEAVFGHRPFLVWADHLTRRGIAVLRVDDRGVGGSTGRYSQATSEDFASDILAGVEFLKTRQEVDAKKIGLVGHSEGGLIAPIVATRSKDVAFIVLMAGPGIPGDSIMILQSAAMRRSIGVADESIAREMGVTRRLYSRIRAGDSLGVVRTGQELVRLQMAGLSDDQRRAAGDPDSLGVAAMRQLFTPWMRYFVTYDPRPTLKRVRCPVLALNGSKDLQVLPKENLDAIEAAFRDGGVPDFTVKELPGLNHMFQTCRLCTFGEYGQLEETIAPSALDEMSGWILARTTPKQ